MDEHLNRVHAQLRAHVVGADWTAFDDDLGSVIATCRQLMRERDEARADAAVLREKNAELRAAIYARDKAHLLIHGPECAECAELYRIAEEAKGE